MAIITTLAAVVTAVMALVFSVWMVTQLFAKH
jgi:hypothetical protein